jgi:CRISPR-associated protein Cas2
MSRRRYIVSYDVRDQARLRRTHKKMLGFGDPLQYSVFLCDLSEVELARMEIAVRAVLNLKQDSLMIADLGPIEGWRRGRIKFLGTGQLPGSGKLRVI